MHYSTKFQRYPPRGQHPLPRFRQQAWIAPGGMEAVQTPGAAGPPLRQDGLAGGDRRETWTPIDLPATRRSKEPQATGVSPFFLLHGAAIDSVVRLMSSKLFGPADFPLVVLADEEDSLAVLSGRVGELEPDGGRAFVIGGQVFAPQLQRLGDFCAARRRRIATSSRRPARGHDAGPIEHGLGGVCQRPGPRDPVGTALDRSARDGRRRRRDVPLRGTLDGHAWRGGARTGNRGALGRCALVGLAARLRRRGNTNQR